MGSSGMFLIKGCSFLAGDRLSDVVFQDQRELVPVVVIEVKDFSNPLFSGKGATFDSSTSLIIVLNMFL